MSKASKTTKERHGDDFYKSIGSKGGSSHSGKKSAQTILEKYGDNYFSEIGKKGAETRKKKSINKKSGFLTKFFKK